MISRATSFALLVAGLSLGLAACQTTAGGPATSASAPATTPAATSVRVAQVTSGMSCGELRTAYRQNLSAMGQLEDQVKARMGIPQGQATQGLVAQNGTPEERAASEAATAAASQAIIRANAINCTL